MVPVDKKYLEDYGIVTLKRECRQRGLDDEGSFGVVARRLQEDDDRVAGKLTPRSALSASLSQHARVRVSSPREDTFGSG